MRRQSKIPPSPNSRQTRQISAESGSRCWAVFVRRYSNDSLHAQLTWKLGTVEGASLTVLQHVQRGLTVKNKRSERQKIRFGATGRWRATRSDCPDIQKRVAETKIVSKICEGFEGQGRIQSFRWYVIVVVLVAAINITSFTNISRARFASGGYCSN